MSLPVETPGPKSEFVLDDAEPEDEDEEMLAFEAARRTGSREKKSFACEDEFEEPVEQTAESSTAHPTLPSPAPLPFPDAVVLSSIPGNANRTQVESFLDGCGDISAFRICRMPNGTIVARVQFLSEEGAVAAVKRDGLPFSDTVGSVITVSDAPADWDEFIRNHPSKPAGSAGSVRAPSGSDAGPLRGAVMIGNVPVNLAEALPDAEEVKSAFWGAISSAKKAAEALDRRARAAGADLDKRFHVADQVSEASKRSQDAMAEVDANYKVREKLDAATAAAKVRADQAAEGAKSVDNTYGISRAIGEVSAKVTRATSMAAREVDENLRISERARDATNSALQNESFAPVVKRALADAESAWQSVAGSAGDGKVGRPKKERAPSGIEQDALELGVNSFTMDALSDELESSPGKTDS